MKQNQDSLRFDILGYLLVLLGSRALTKGYTDGYSPTDKEKQTSELPVITSRGSLEPQSPEAYRRLDPARGTLARNTH